MKFTSAAPAVAFLLICHPVVAAPFARSVVATTIGYKSVQFAVKKGDTQKIAMPVTYRPVHIMVANITPYYQGTGEAVITSFPGEALEWTGSDTWSAANGTTEHGSSQVKGAHILWADYAATVDIQVVDPTDIRILNNTGETQTVVVTFLY